MISLGFIQIVTHCRYSALSVMFQQVTSSLYMHMIHHVQFLNATSLNTSLWIKASANYLYRHLYAVQTLSKRGQLKVLLENWSAGHSESAGQWWGFSDWRKGGESDLSNWTELWSLCGNTTNTNSWQFLTVSVSSMGSRMLLWTRPLTMPTRTCTWAPLKYTGFTEADTSSLNHSTWKNISTAYESTGKRPFL